MLRSRPHAHVPVFAPLLVLLLVALAGCSERDTVPPPPDSGASLDGGGSTTDGGGSTTDGGGGPSDAGEPDAGDPPGDDTYEFVIAMLDVGRAASGGDPSVVPGFDLDARVSDGSDAMGCFHPDFTSPAPDMESGVDNQMGPVLASLGSSFDITGTIASNIADGLLVLLARVSGVGSLSNDPSVRIELFNGQLAGGGGPPLLDASGRVAPGQSFETDVAIGSGTGSIVAGRLRARGLSFALDIPTGTGGASLSLTMTNVETRFDIATTGLDTGVLGGQMIVDDVISAVVAIDPTTPVAVVRSLFELQADLSPDADGACKDVSIGLVFEAVPATIVTP